MTFDAEQAVNDFFSAQEAQKAAAVKQDEWDRYFINMCRFVSQKSKDQSTKCGCVIVGPGHEVRSTGYNGLVRGCEYSDERQARPEKYFWFEHSERNAVYNAARVGIALEGCTAYVTGCPCHDCARALIQSGIKTVVFPQATPHHGKGFDDRWAESMKRSRMMFNEAGVVVRVIVEDQPKSCGTDTTVADLMQEM